MIQLTTPEGRRAFVSPQAIASVCEAGVSSQWHGTRAIVRMVDGRVIEVSESAAEVSEMVDANKD
jgi:uncharacterized protein YlzI (FlbEa/FlbD family)